MSISIGQRVIIISGLSRGRHGSVVKVRQDMTGGGQVLVDIRIDGQSDPIPYFASHLQPEERTQ